MALDSRINRSVLISIFPDLADDNNFKILSECTYVYNCIAWAMGYTDRWVTPILDSGYWWPDGVERSFTPEALVKAFQAEGFEKSDNCNPEEGFLKVVLYKSCKGDCWTHAARIVTNTTEHSKFGQLFDGQHSHDVLCKTGAGHDNESYGVAYAYMKRPALGKAVAATGNVVVNADKAALLRAKLGI